MTDKTDNGAKTRAEKVVQDLLNHGWHAEKVGATVVYQKPAPIREREPSQNAETE